ncbi:hypothetical protein PybrP1_009957 [[Pythium] brassicae (nom. inval.)]|nr:hypothetical protein PybrP1_009957 [[Pythium] brassicae (nom. inval.)]
MEQAWRAAAEKIAAADFLLVAAGAGFSADSGLPVYNDIASVAAYEALGVDYQDLCDPYWLEEDEEIFYGFWGHCFNAYRDAASHRGYEILRRWKQQLVRKRGDRRAFQRTFQQLRVSGALPASATVFPDSVTSDPFFVYTSNVDAHFHRSFGADEVYELHGSVELWQCAGVRGTGAASAPCEATWRVDPGTRFDVDTDAMRAAGGDVARCRACGGRGRPNVLMFSDRSWLPNVRDEERYVAWEAVMEQMLQEDPSLRLVVLEIGCGLRVPSVRKECEMVVADLFERCGGRGQASLIRVNPEFAHCDHPVLTANALVLSLPTTGLAALEAIDQVLTGQASS